MKQLLFLIMFFYTQVGLFAQEYFPEGTKWTEIRLDTMKYDSWYSKVDDEWVPNFETIEYHVQGEYTDKYSDTYKCIYTNGPEWTDSLALLIQERDNRVWVTVLDNYDVENPYVLCPAEAYQFDWSVGKGLYFDDILLSNVTDSYCYHYYFGIISEIKEGDFGGVRPLKYVDLDGKAPVDPQQPGNRDTEGGRIIQGIGVAEWKDGECLFGPSDPYFASARGARDSRHYRSMLVHFERNNEVLYDVWPQKGVIDGIKTIIKDKASIAENTFYDLQGRRLSDKPDKGLYIQNGKKYVVK